MITKKGKKVIVFTVGVFDFIHIGHLNFLRKAKLRGTYLKVAVQKNIKKYKPEAETVYTLSQRIDFLRSLKFVDEVIIYNDVDKIIKKVKFDIFAKGPDQVHKGFQNAVEYSKKKGKKVVTISRTKNISSSKLRYLINNLEL